MDLHTVRYVLASVEPCFLLDVGGGDGALARLLELFGFEVLVVEENPHLCERAASLGSSVRNEAIEHVSGVAADALIYSRSLHHTSDLEVALESGLRVLRPGGVLLIEDFGRDLVDLPALRWLYKDRPADEPLELMARWRSEHPPSEVASSRRLAAAVKAVLGETEHTLAPYLYRYLPNSRDAPHELQLLLEAAMIKQRQIPAVGLRWKKTL